MKIILVRHAKTKIDRNTKSSDWSLISGYKNDRILEKVRSFSSNTNIYSSDEEKAILTAEVFRKDQEIIRSKWLREVERGSVFLENYGERVADFFNYPEISTDNWESANGAYKRFSDGLGKVVNSSERDVILVGHGLIFSLFRAVILNKKVVEMKDWQALLMPDYAIVEKRLSGYRLIKDFEGIIE